jgi:hypothetical protein
MPHLVLALAILGGGVFAACGGSSPPPTVPASVSSSEGPSTGGTPSPAKSAEVTAPPISSAPSTLPAPALTTSVAIVPTAMTSDLKAIGIDLATVGELSKIDMAKKRKLMGLFVKALGMPNCEGCHAPGDFKADTHNKRMASSMWNHFVRNLRMKGGTPVFCDSCHQGQQQLLARVDKKALSSFMRANYEEKLERTDKKDHS